MTREQPSTTLSTALACDARKRTPGARMRRNGERGALLVEAIVVVVFFIIAFTGMLFFHAMYRKTLHTMRLSRAATLGYAMVGCRGDTSAGLSGDIGELKAAGSSLGTEQVSYPGGSASPGSPEASRAVGASSGVSSSVGNDIARFGVSGTVSQGGAGAAFSADVTSYSYMACADKVRDSQTSETAKNATNAISF